MSPSSIRSASLASLTSLPSGTRPLAPSLAPHAAMPAPPPPPLPRGSNSSSMLPDLIEQRRLINAYFDGPHYFCFYTFIHPPTLMQLFDNRLVPDLLLLIILATALRFLDPRDRRADAWADECRRLVMLEIFSPPSTTTLQALLLLQRFEWHRASHVAAWFLSGLAVRLAHGLQLNLEIAQSAGGNGNSNGDSREGRTVPVTVREARRRLIWSCFVMESLIENGRRPLSSMDAGAIEVRLPCNEQAFQLGLETGMPTLNSLTTKEHQQPPEAPLPLLPAPSASVVESRLGISTYLVQLAAMRRAILDYTMPYHPRNKHHVAAAMAAASNTSAAGSAASSPSSCLRRSAQPLARELAARDAFHGRDAVQKTVFTACQFCHAALSVSRLLLRPVPDRIVCQLPSPTVDFVDIYGSTGRVPCRLPQRPRPTCPGHLPRHPGEHAAPASRT